MLHDVDRFNEEHAPRQLQLFDFRAAYRVCSNEKKHVMDAGNAPSIKFDEGKTLPCEEYPIRSMWPPVFDKPFTCLN